MKIKIIYGTQSGTTGYVAEAIQKYLSKQGHQVDLHHVGKVSSPPVLEGYDAVLIGAPTYEDGCLEMRMNTLISNLEIDLSKYKVGVFGLGSKIYSHFCESAKILEEWVVKNQGKLAIPPLKIDGFPDNLQPITDWADQFTKV
jgi:flavodoxin